MFAFISVVIGFVVIKFFYDKTQQSIQIGKQGGMANKYKDLIGYLLDGNKSARVIKETNDSILIGSSSVGGQTLFNLVQTFGTLTVQWNIDSLNSHLKCN